MDLSSYFMYWLMHQAYSQKLQWTLKTERAVNVDTHITELPL